MLSHGPAPDPKGKVIFHHSLHFHIYLDCVIYANNAMSTLLLLQTMGGWDKFGGGWLIYIRVWMGRQWVGIISFFLVLLYFVLSFPHPVFSFLTRLVK